MTTTMTTTTTTTTTKRLNAMLPTHLQLLKLQVVEDAALVLQLPLQTLAQRGEVRGAGGGVEEADRGSGGGAEGVVAGGAAAHLLHHLVLPLLQHQQFVPLTLDCTLLLVAEEEAQCLVTVMVYCFCDAFVVSGYHNDCYPIDTLTLSLPQPINFMG